MSDDKKEKAISELHSIRANSEMEFNRVLILISTGGIGVSVTILGFIINKGIDINWLLSLSLIFSWMLFLIAICLNLYSYIHTINVVDTFLDGDIEKGEEMNNKSLRYNKISMWFSFAGIVFLLLFSGGIMCSDYSTKNEKQKENLHEGYTVSKDTIKELEKGLSIPKDTIDNLKNDNNQPKVQQDK